MQQTILMSQSIKITPVPVSRIASVDFDNLPFGKVCTDHMFSADYINGEWVNAKIGAFENLSFPPSISALHYGQIIFEGMKAYRDPEGNPLLFRPVENHRRFARSAHRMAMPEVPEKLFIEALIELVTLDKDWIPAKKGSALYLRPFMFAVDEYIGIRPAEKFKFIIFACPVGDYYARPVRVLISKKFVRAFKGGTGYAKAAGNYGGTMLPIREANKLGYDQLLWLDGCSFQNVQEIGTMNVFFLIGEKLITPSLEDG